MSDTPRTDAIERVATDATGAVTRMEPIWEGLQALERELNEANKELNKIYIEYDALFDEAAQIRIERDAAKELIREIRDNEVNEVDEATKFLRDYPINEHN